MKKLLVIAATAAAAVVLNRKWRESKVVKTTWSKATDPIN
ncbi:DLW-39 family protein [Specibacter sp. NPDC057265]